MTTYERIEQLRKSANISQGNLEKELGFSNGSISKWKKSSPKPERLQKIAEYFNVSMEYLLTGEEKEWQPTITEKDEKDIQKQLQKTLDQLENETGLMFDGDYMDEEAREKLKNSLELVMRGARIEAKEKFTPKKYKK